ncbi:tyrosine-type recombinase/integrase [Pseudolactococcus reticulitermitis]|uniref:Tyr recombinase domain-containing protein n=1 Tax=Pseudolactococcus reticulitermitis TaxID=2025039 RepID=A0A224WWX4_9LACT|nr:site-specific integrase [Lactococcus reticulitermitis]GAX46808.1 hypothetical protein RsY01_388 [Lactococcus reticulitermitis]
MWSQQIPNGRYQYFERYIDPYTEKMVRISVTLDGNSRSMQKQAALLLNEKISRKLNELSTTDALLLDVSKEWWEQYKKTLKQSSISSMTSGVNYLLNTINPHTKIKNVNVKFIQNIINDDNIKRSQLERIKSVLNLIFDYAVTLEYVTDNPARRAKLPKRVKTLEDLEKVNNKYLEQSELSDILAELYRRPDTYRHGLLAEFMSLNGCRMGEAIALKYDNYHKSDKTIDIHGTLDTTVGYAKGDKTTPKTVSSYRTVELSDREIAIIDEMIAISQTEKMINPTYHNMGFIFVSNSGIPIQINSFNLTLKRANTRLKTPIKKNFSSHIFRHSLVSFLAENNVPLKAIMDRVGHSHSSKTTSEIYTHVTENMKSSIIDILNAK